MSKFGACVDRTLTWIGNNKLLTFFIVAAFSLMVSTWALAETNNRFRAEIALLQQMTSPEPTTPSEAPPPETTTSETTTSGTTSDIPPSGTTSDISSTETTTDIPPPETTAMTPEPINPVAGSGMRRRRYA